MAWIEGTNFQHGTIDIELRGKDRRVCSFVGVAFHRADDNTYEAVYVRPYTFRIADLRLKHQTVQYITMPEHERDRRRRDFDADKWAAVARPVTSVGPNDWVVLRVVVSTGRLQAYVDDATAPTLEVKRSGQLRGGEVGAGPAATGTSDAS
ncbi:MAG: hypothetical protein IT184_16540 [Acidobacteria bacterium]|nr:hypothetical protein [Acidobacteriota bacterium]